MILRGDLVAHLTVQDRDTRWPSAYDHHASFVSVMNSDGERDGDLATTWKIWLVILAVDEVKVKRIDDDTHETGLQTEQPLRSQHSLPIVD